MTMTPARSIRPWLPATPAHSRHPVSQVSALVLATIAFVVACSNGGGGGSGSTCASGECKLTASDGEAIDTFGYAVAIAGDAIVVGSASGDIEDNGDRSGAAYVYRFDGTDWIEEQKLIASDAKVNDQFGRSVAIEGDVIVVGARLTDDNGDTAGSAYIYRFDGTSWIEEQELLALDGQLGDLFGSSVAIAGDAVVIGADSDDDDGNSSGSAYVFRYDPLTMLWTEEQKLKPADGAAFKFFGGAVAMLDDAVVVGARLDGESGLFAGAAYVFRYDPMTMLWSEEQKLLGSDTASGDLFGTSVSIAEDLVAIGAFLDDDTGKDSGSTFVYRFDGAAWVEEAKLNASDAATEDYFGINVGIDGDKIVVGANRDNDNGSRSGSAYVYRYDGAGWVEQRKITASDGRAGDFFGFSVDLDAGMVVIGAYLDDNPSKVASGSAYVYELEP